MANKGLPTLNLDSIQLRESAAQPVAKVPLGPAPFIGIFRGVGKDRVLFRDMMVLVRYPSIVLPGPKRQSAVCLKQIHGYIGMVRAELIEHKSREKTVFRELQNTVIKILSLKNPQGEHFLRTHGGFKRRIKGLARGRCQGIRIPLSHPIIDVDGCSRSIGGFRVALRKDGEHGLEIRFLEDTFIVKFEGYHVPYYSLRILFGILLLHELTFCLCCSGSPGHRRQVHRRKPKKNSRDGRTHSECD
jgi:hypothetical protein